MNFFIYACLDDPMLIMVTGNIIYLNRYSVSSLIVYLSELASCLKAGPLALVRRL